MNTFSIREALRRKKQPMEYAVMRMPLNGGSEEFVAHWPQNATAADFRVMLRFFGACMEGWIASAELWEATKADASAAEAEYASWFDVEPRQQEGWDVPMTAAPAARPTEPDAGTGEAG